MMYDKLNDNELVALYKSGDAKAFEILLSRNQQKVFNYIYALVKDKALADDIFQDTYIKVINTLQNGAYHDEGKYIQWVMRIAHNLVIDYYRKNQRFPIMRTDESFDIFDFIDSREESVEQKIIKDQTHSDVKRLIMMLPEEQRKVWRYLTSMYGRQPTSFIITLFDFSLLAATEFIRKKSPL